MLIAIRLHTFCVFSLHFSPDKVGSLFSGWIPETTCQAIAIAIAKP